MEQTIADILNKVHKMNDDYIAETLKRYIILTPDETVCNMLKHKLGSDIALTLSPYLSNEHKLYAFLPSKGLFPIIQVYGEPKIEQDIINCTYKAYCNMWLEAGGIIL